MQCRRCLKEGHKAIDCPNEEVCLSCKQPGHRKGDPKCIHSEKVRLTKSRNIDMEEYTDLWWGGASNGNTAGADNQSEGEDVEEEIVNDDVMNLVSSAENQVENENEENLMEDSAKEPGHSSDIKVSSATDRVESHCETEQQDSSNALIETASELVEERTQAGENAEKLDCAEEKEDDMSKGIEIEEGEILEEPNVKKVKKSTYKEKLLENPARENRSNGKNKVNRASKTMSEASNTPVSQRGMVQSILNFVGKRNSDTLSPEGPGSKPQPKRPAKNST